MFGVALDDANGPNAYLTATSAFGLHRAGNGVNAVRLRYRSEPVPATISATDTGAHAKLEIALGEDFAGVSPGQTAVLLAGEAIVGHGTIAAAS